MAQCPSYSYFPTSTVCFPPSALCATGPLCCAFAVVTRPTTITPIANTLTNLKYILSSRQKFLFCLIDLLHFYKLARVLPDEHMGARQAHFEFRIEFELFF